MNILLCPKNYTKLNIEQIFSKPIHCQVKNYYQSNSTNVSKTTTKSN